MSFLQRLRPALGGFKRRAPTNLSLSATPFYELSPPWWTRWTYFLVAANATFTITAAELTWNHWTEPVEPIPEPPAPKFVLRPMWQRAAAVTGQVAVGSYLAFMIIVGRTRIIQKLWILPSSAALDASSKDKQVFMQCVHHFKRQGQLYPYKTCKLQETRTQDTEILMKIDGVRGFYSLALEGAKINGQEWASGGKGMQIKWAKEELVDSWRAEGGGKRKNRPRFVSGPAASWS